MNEIPSISKLFKEIYNGSPWIDVSLVPVLQQITASNTAERISPQWNLIWEIVNHIISWRLNVLKRLKGIVIPTPAHNYFLPVNNISDAARADTLKNLEQFQQGWLIFLQNFNEKYFLKIYPKNNLSYYEHIHGILQHDVTTWDKLLCFQKQ